MSENLIKHFQFILQQSGTPEERKAVFIVSGLLVDTVAEIIKVMQLLQSEQSMDVCQE